ncbi:glycosyltransferase family 2 protein [Edaphobacter bradus]|uniref:glycosyltransferase family 2 protein n=1 Tax=Edaphobacter bradus TaxID=2259016 RepID=UPI0021E0AF06|nr:glycosyltransferase family 2 protein [Edaphobacter bradus]
MHDTADASPSVCCVIVNWNGWQDTLDCLSSLRTQDYRNLQIVVVDNGSTNDSAGRIRSAFPEVTLIETGKNLGFPKGCNVGIQTALAGSAEFVWLLNNDTVCPQDTLRKLVRRAMASPEAGLVGTVLLYAHDPTQVQAWGGGKVRPWIAYSTHFHAPVKFDKNCYTTFASVLARRAMLEEVGLLYEGFFMYCDDTDLCLRMQETHWKIVMAEDTAVLHKEGASTPKSQKPFMTKTITVSSLRFIRRHSRLALIGMPLYLALRSGNRIVQRDWNGLRAVWQGATEFVREPMP